MTALCWAPLNPHLPPCETGGTVFSISQMEKQSSERLRALLRVTQPARITVGLELQSVTHSLPTHHKPSSATRQVLRTCHCLSFFATNLRPMCYYQPPFTDEETEAGIRETTHPEATIGGWQRQDSNPVHGQGPRASLCAQLPHSSSPIGQEALGFCTAGQGQARRPHRDLPAKGTGLQPPLAPGPPSLVNPSPSSSPSVPMHSPLPWPPLIPSHGGSPA